VIGGFQKDAEFAIGIDFVDPVGGDIGEVEVAFEVEGGTFGEFEIRKDFDGVAYRTNAGDRIRLQGGCGDDQREESGGPVQYVSHIRLLGVCGQRDLGKTRSTDIRVGPGCKIQPT
jgi:hypothetical protein